MSKGVMKKTIISLLFSVMIITPFSFSAAAEDINLGWYYSVSWWQSNGMTTIIPTESFSVGSHYLSVPALTFYDNIEGGGGANGYTCYATSVNSNGVSQWSCYLRSNNGSTYGGGQEVIQSDGFFLTESSYQIVNNSTHFYTTLSGSYNIVTLYDNDKRIAVEANDIYDIFFMTDKSKAPFQLQPQIFTYPNTTYSMTITEQPVQVYGDYYLHHFTVTTDLSSDIAYGTPIFHGLNGYSGEIVPVYMGNRKYMPSDLYSTLIGNPLTQGDSQSLASGSNLDNKADDLSAASDTLHSFEEDTISDMNVQFNNIDVDGEGLSLVTNGNFLTSANWVRTQFNRMITGNVFGTLIYFSLVLGLALLVLGKLRK